MNLAVPNSSSEPPHHLIVPLEAQLYETSSARGRTATMIGNGATRLPIDHRLREKCSCHVV
jgi:hypothetical protein